MSDERNTGRLAGRHDEPSAIDRELQEELAVEPSPDFVARVRIRLASEPTRSVPRWGFVFAGAAAAVAVIAVVVTLVAPGQKRGVAPVPSPLEARSLAPAVAALPASVASDLSRTPTSLASGVNRTSTRPLVRLKADTTNRVVEPEVLVPQAEIEMYRRLIARSRTLGRAALVETVPEIETVSGTVAELQPPAKLTIDPIKIDPIIPQSSGEGERP